MHQVSILLSLSFLAKLLPLIEKRGISFMKSVTLDKVLVNMPVFGHFMGFVIRSNCFIRMNGLIGKDMTSGQAK